MSPRASAVLLLGCAWVLWSHSMSTKPDFDVWHLEQVMPTNAGCEREKQLTQQAYARQARQSGDVKTAKDAVYLTRGEQTIVFAWYCYPDTIDPRQPKR